AVFGAGADRRQSGPLPGRDWQGAKYRAGAAGAHAARARAPAMVRTARLVRRRPVPFAVHDRGRQGSHGADREFGGAARAADGQVHRARSAPLAAGTTAEVRQATIKHDPEKWDPVFGKDHAQTTGSAAAD